MSENSNKSKEISKSEWSRPKLLIKFFKSLYNILNNEKLTVVTPSLSSITQISTLLTCFTAKELNQDSR
jgi:hypothetical protein